MKARRLIEDMMPGSTPDDQMPHGSPSGNKPKPAKTMSIGEIMAVLPKHVHGQLVDILNRCNPDAAKAAKELKALLRPYAAQLEKIGVVPDYAAYVIPWAVYSRA